jgi:hypothetical protein
MLLCPENTVEINILIDSTGSSVRLAALRIKVQQALLFAACVSSMSGTYCSRWAMSSSMSLLRVLIVFVLIQVGSRAF